ncbi:hypothetical protein DFH07DRAFT_852583 [Mycena maculata]|uniref:Uncharacterized protein n=1 Tax=Mycena maculata TaxID=230809 RepID=A0AAD7HRJ4_9AGAR|nr:hypothetical protein DFH07DRAFT_852583 [Mycena maculata]
MWDSSWDADRCELETLAGSFDRRRVQVAVQVVPTSLLIVKREIGEGMSEVVERSSGERAVCRVILHVTRRGAGRRVSSRASKPLASKRRDDGDERSRTRSIGGRKHEGVMDGSRDAEKDESWWRRLEAKSLPAESTRHILQTYHFHSNDCCFAKTSAGKERSTRHYLRSWMRSQVCHRGLAYVGTIEARLSKRRVERSQDMFSDH